MKNTRKRVGETQHKFPIGPAPMIFYRYYSNRGRVSLEKFYLVKQTPAGYWIKHQYAWSGDKDKWISNNSAKCLAYPTKKEAMQNFIARKNRQIKILKARLFEAEADYRWAKTGTRNKPFKMGKFRSGELL